MKVTFFCDTERRVHINSMCGVDLVPLRIVYEWTGMNEFHCNEYPAHKMALRKWNLSVAGAVSPISIECRFKCLSMQHPIYQ